MKKRFSRSNLNKFLKLEADTEEVVHSHAYRKISRKRGPVLSRTKRAPLPHPKTVPGYQSSMVGSIAQYRDLASIRQQDPKEKKKPEHDHDVIGNRPRSKTEDSKKDHKRHHFSEPPKRNFYKFD